MTASAKNQARDGGNPWLDELSWGETLWVALFPVLFLVGLLRAAGDERIHLFYELSWVYAFSCAAVAPSFVRARFRRLGDLLAGNRVEENAVHEPVRQYERRLMFSSQPLVLGLSACAGFLAFRLLVTWDLIPYQGEVVKLVHVLTGGAGMYLLARALWQFLSFGYLISHLSEVFEEHQDKLFSWQLLEDSGKGYSRTAIGAACLSLGVFVMAVSAQTTVLGMAGGFLDQLVMYTCYLVLALLMPMLYLVVPVWRLHRILVARKGNIRALFQDELAGIEREFLQKPEKEVGMRYLQARRMAE